MQIIYLEASVGGIQRDFYDKFPKTSRAFISKRARAEDLTQYKQPPIYSDGWLLLFNGLPSKALLSCLTKQPEQNLVVYKVASNKVCNVLVGRLQELNVPFKVIDNLNSKEEDILNYIHSNLIIDDEAAKFLYRRFNGYAPNIIIAVQTLIPYKIVTKEIIQKATTKDKNVPIYCLPNHLLGLEPDANSALSVIYQYRFAAKYLLDYLSTTINLRLKVYRLIEDGTLSLYNYKEFLKSTSDKDLAGLRDYHLQKLIESYKFVSIDYLVFLKLQIEQIPGTLGSLYRLVNLVKLGG